MTQIVYAVAMAFQVEVSELLSRERHAEVSFARQVAMYLCWLDTLNTLWAIGQSLGGRSPATISYGIQRVATRIFNEPHLKDKLANIRRGYG